MEAEKVLIAVADPKLAELASIKLSNAGYIIIMANNGETALEKAAANQPDLFLIDWDLPGVSSLEICYELKTNPQLGGVPVILIVDQQFDCSVMDSARIKVDDLLVKPFTPKNLLAKVNASFANYRLVKQINPKTLLPGKVHLSNAVNAIIDRGGHFELVFCDLRDFRIYNKVYGCDHGDLVIAFTAKLLRELVAKIDIPGAELYHLGGDDFVVLSPELIPETFYREAIDLFQKGIVNFYSEEDLRRGGIAFTNRRGLAEQSPVITIDLAVVGNGYRHLINWLEAELIGAELLKYSKTMPGSSWVRDRRRE